MSLFPSGETRSWVSPSNGHTYEIPVEVPEGMESDHFLFEALEEGLLRECSEHDLVDVEHPDRWYAQGCEECDCIVDAADALGSVWGTVFYLRKDLDSLAADLEAAREALLVISGWDASAAKRHAAMGMREYAAAALARLSAGKETGDE